MQLESRNVEGALECAREYIRSRYLPMAVIAVADCSQTLALRCFDGRAEEEPSLGGRIFALASITKPIVAAGIACLADRGLLRYDDPIAKHVPEFGALPWRREITIADVLTHTTGLACVPLMDILSPELSGDENALKLFCDEPAYEPRKRHQYSTLTFQLFNVIVRRLTGKRMSAFLAEYVFAPCGMTETAFHPTDPARAVPVEGHPADTPDKLRRFSDFELSGGGLWSSAADLVRFGQALLTHKLLSKKTFADYIQPRPSLPFAAGEGFGYRTFGWNFEPQSTFPHRPASGVYHGGATGTLLWIDPERGLIFVFLTNRWICNDAHGFAVLDFLYR